MPQVCALHERESRHLRERAPDGQGPSGDSSFFVNLEVLQACPSAADDACHGLQLRAVKDVDGQHPQCGAPACACMVSCMTSLAAWTRSSSQELGHGWQEVAHVIC